MTSPALHRLLSIVFFFILCSFLMMQVVLPFWQKLRTFYLFDLPYLPLILGSSLLYLCSIIVSHLLEENDYGSIAFISHLAIKIWIVTLWLDELGQLLKQWEKLLVP
ncbi:hypothetical protein ACIQ4I_09125 [Rummeliibacillus sp. NPDC094406]|uniref:hypothetical protein n=1 Tax=Rummeliibacillus sp. NPDC094406 TaxID=3364511 RepID=UPI0037FA114C